MVLTAMREGAKSGFSKLILFGFMGMAVGGLVLMDVGGFFTSRNVATGTVLSIDGKKYQAVEFDRVVRRALANQGMDPQTAWQLGLIDQILNAEISTNLLARAADDAGIYVGDDTVAQQVAEIAAPYVSGETNRKDALRRILLSQGISEAEFINSIRQDMTNNILRTAVVLAAGVESSKEARAMYEYNQEKRVIDALILPHDKGIDIPAASDDVLRPFYQAGIERYAVPETRSFTVAVLNDSSVRSSITLTDEDLKAQYEAMIQGYQVPEKRALEQTILTDRAVGDAIAKRVKDGESLKNAVKAETGSEDAYLGVAEFEEKGLAKDIAAEAFKGNKGDVIGPVQTALGYHVLVLKDTIPARTRPFAEVRDELRRTVMQSRLSEQMFGLSAQIDDGIAAGTPLEELAEQLDMKIEKFGAVRNDGSTVEDKEGFTKFTDDRDAILRSVFDHMDGETSNVFDLKDGSFAVVRTDTINPRHHRAFEDVRTELAKQWEQDQRETLNKQRAEKALLRLETGESTLSALAAEMGVQTRSLTLTRADDAAAPLDNAAKTLLFEPAVGGHTLAPVKDGFVIGTVKSVTIPDADKAKAEALADIGQTTMRNAQNEIFLSYLESLRKQYNVKINRDILQQLYGQQPDDEAAF